MFFDLLTRGRTCDNNLFSAKTVIDIFGHECELGFEVDLHNIENSINNLFALAFNEAKQIT